MHSPSSFHSQNFDNMDILLKLANARSNKTKIHLLYSTPSCFIKVKYLPERKNVVMIKGSQGSVFRQSTKRS